MPRTDPKCAVPLLLPILWLQWNLYSSSFNMSWGMLLCSTWVSQAVELPWNFIAQIWSWIHQLQQSRTEIGSPSSLLCGCWNHNGYFNLSTRSDTITVCVQVAKFACEIQIMYRNSGLIQSIIFVSDKSVVIWWTHKANSPVWFYFTVPTTIATAVPVPTTASAPVAARVTVALLLMFIAFVIVMVGLLLVKRRRRMKAVDENLTLAILSRYCNSNAISRFKTKSLSGTFQSIISSSGSNMLLYL